MWVLHIFEIIVHILLTLFGYQGYCPDEIDGEGNDELSQRCSILLTWGGLAVLQIYSFHGYIFKTLGTPITLQGNYLTDAPLVIYELGI
jgi:hypothetical protein